ncbi:MAG: PAS domain-containing sensor histidine kinase, partial [Deltaproteobacteria bacterium]|nr:PAS domain-containing sensor histidine kinase [Deltaproteobacteria bacterium]
MANKKYKKPASYISEEERNRRKREVIIICVIIAVVAILTFAESRIIHFGAGIPVSNTILMFILININLLLLILLIFLVFRNLVKLLYDRKRKVMGAKLRTKLVVAFITLSLLPTTILFFFSINFITTSIEFWFNVPVEQALENSLLVGRSLYWHAEEEKALSNYIQIVQREFNLHAVELYDANANRLTFSLSPELEDMPFGVVSADNLLKQMPLKGVRSISESNLAGELIRTIGTIPFGAKRANAEAFVVLTRLMPPDLSENM